MENKEDISFKIKPWDFIPVLGVITLSKRFERDIIKGKNSQEAQLQELIRNYDTLRVDGNLPEEFVDEYIKLNRKLVKTNFKNLLKIYGVFAVQLAEMYAWMTYN